MKPDDVFQLLADIAGSIGVDIGNSVLVDIQYAAVLNLPVHQLPDLSPQLFGFLRGRRKKGFVAVIGGIIVLDKVMHIHITAPVAFDKIHGRTSIRIAVNSLSYLSRIRRYKSSRLR